MLVVRVELHSANTRQVTELARVTIANVGGTDERGDYSVKAYRGGTTKQLDKKIVSRESEVKNYPRVSLHVWNLVARALAALEYK